MEPTQLLSYAQRLQAIAQAGIAYSITPYDLERYEEIRLLSVKLLQELKAANEELCIQKRELELAKQHSDHWANHDALTDLPNRRAFQTKLKAAIEASANCGRVAVATRTRQLGRGRRRGTYRRGLARDRAYGAWAGRHWRCRSSDSLGTHPTRRAQSPGASRGHRIAGSGSLSRREPVPD